MQKYYAVKKGRRPGVYASWEECQRQVAGFDGARFKSFLDLEEAKNYVIQNLPDKPKQPQKDYSNEPNDGRIFILGKEITIENIVNLIPQEKIDLAIARYFDERLCVGKTRIVEANRQEENSSNTSQNNNQNSNKKKNRKNKKKNNQQIQKGINPSPHNCPVSSQNNLSKPVFEDENEYDPFLADLSKNEGNKEIDAAPKLIPNVASATSDNTSNNELHLYLKSFNNEKIRCSSGYISIIVNPEENRKLLMLSNSGSDFTKNRLEILAMKEAFEQIHGKWKNIKIVTESEFLYRVFTNKWLQVWKRAMWTKSDGTAVSNVALWKELEAVIEKYDYNVSALYYNQYQKENDEFWKECEDVAKTTLDKVKVK